MTLTIGCKQMVKLGVLTQSQQPSAVSWLHVCLAASLIHFLVTPLARSKRNDRKSDKENRNAASLVLDYKSTNTKFRTSLHNTKTWPASDLTCNSIVTKWHP